MFDALRKMFRSRTPAEKWESDQAKMRVSPEELAELRRELPETPAMRREALKKKEAVRHFVTVIFEGLNASVAVTKRFASRCGRFGTEGNALDAILEGIRDAEDLPPGLFILADWKDVVEASVQIDRAANRRSIQLDVMPDRSSMDNLLSGVQEQLRKHELTLLEINTDGDELFAAIVNSSRLPTILEAARPCEIKVNARAGSPRG